MSVLRDEILADQQDDDESKRRIRQQQALIDRQRSEIADLQREMGLVTRIQGAVVKPPAWTIRHASKRGKHAIATYQLTDTHFDEVVNPAEVDYINAYDRAIAEKRLQRWVEKGIVLARDYVAGVEIDGAALFATGDLLSGDIHDELKQSNADHLYSSAYHWIGRMAWAINEFANEFGKLHIAAVVGNHGRSTRKPVFKGRARSNIEWLMWSVLAREFARDTRITFQVADSMDANVTLYATRYVLTHGDQFHGGSGISGILTPISLGQYRKGVRQAATEHPMDVLVMGHFHQLLTLPGLIVGGSMKGYDEYAFGHNLRPEQPQQAFWLTTPEHGITVHAPVLVADRKAEGW